MKKYLLVVFILGIFVSLFIFLVPTAKADCEVGNFLPPCTCSGFCKLEDFLALGSNIAQYAVGALAGIALGFIVYGGLTFLMAMGNQEKIAAGKSILGGTFRGIVIVLIAWILVNSIIFFLTGEKGGLLFGQGKPWWEFEETPLEGIYPVDKKYPRTGPCPVRKEISPTKGKVPFPQNCFDTSGWSEGDKQKRHCVSLGVCVGNKYQICCDEAETS